MSSNNIQRRVSFLLAILVCLSITSCDIFKPARDSAKDKVYKDKDGELADIQGRRVFNEETGEWEIVRVLTTKLDTIKWVELAPNKFPPITSDGSFDGGNNPNIDTGPVTITPEGSELKSVYNVSVMLPFFTNQFSETRASLPKNSSWAVNFYSGMRMAAKVLEGEGINLNVEAIDTEGSEATVRSLLRSNAGLNKSDLIIGPYRRNNVKQVADFALKQNITFVSPHSASRNISNQNPFYIQTNPSLKSHCESIAAHVQAKYKREEVVLIARDIAEEKERVTYIQDANYVLTSGKDTVGFEEYIVNDQTADFHELDVLPFIRPGETTVFVIPSYRNETFIYSILRQIALSKTEEDRVIVYGLQPWMNYERVDFDFFENLNVHVSSGSFVDDFDPGTQLLKRQYFEEYGMPPESEVFTGYDILLYCGRMLKKYGTKFQLYVEEEEIESYTQTKFDISRIADQSEFLKEKWNRIDQWENKYVHILKFENYHFQPAD